MFISTFTPSLSPSTPFDASQRCACGRSYSVAPFVMQQEGESGPKGFGAPKEAGGSKKQSSGSVRREAASNKFDEMVASGMPEYTVWFRLKKGGVESDTDEMPWLPVGAISVPRSSQVGDALFEQKTMEDLMQGALRLYPALKKEERDNIEFGYQLKDFDDEPIRIAEPSPKTGWKATLTNLFRRIQNPLNQ